MKKLSIVIVAGAVVLAGCNSQADIASRNVSQQADSFQVQRRVVVSNTRLGTYLLEVQGKCSIQEDAAESQLEIICAVGPDKYRKHFAKLNRDTTYVTEQTDDGTNVNNYSHYVRFNPAEIAPTVVG